MQAMANAFSTPRDEHHTRSHRAAAAAGANQSALRIADCRSCEPPLPV